MKYLLQAIESKRCSIKLSDPELRKLLTEVRKGRDEREEFIESIDRILTELRNYSEHSQAFLVKVSKRDAPDYYDVIKHPMDLGTMQKKVKNGAYKNKKQFAHDLDLIWDNCLTYNSDPSHPLRRNVQFMRKKANHLLEFISDKSDVKDALSHWEAEAELYGEEDADMSTQSQENAHPRGLEGPLADGGREEGEDRGSTVNGLGANGINHIRPSPKVNGSPFARKPTRLSMGRRRETQSDVPFEQRPALIRSPANMSHFAALDAALARFETDIEGALAGPSSQPMDSLSLAPVDATQPLSQNAVLTNLQGLGENGNTGPLAAAFGSRTGSALAGPVGSGTGANSGIGSGVGAKGKARALESDDAWWSAISSDPLLCAGLPSLPHSERLESIRAKKPRKRRRRQRAVERPGLQGMIARNVANVQKLQRTHAKFMTLASSMNSDAPLPAELEESESDDPPSEYETDSDLEGKSGDSFGEWGPPGAHPLSRLPASTARAHISHVSSTVLAHASFEGAHRAALDVLTDVGSEFLMNLGRTLRVYSDRYSHKMSPEELILHTLYENGGTDIAGLESYIRDDVERYGGKMSDLLRRLRSSYREQLQQTADRAAIEDDMLFADDGEALVSGGFAEELGDDFFGFKEMGLDRELGLSGLTVPSRLFHGRGQRHAAAPVQGPAGEPPPPYPPPPAFVPLSSAAIPAQIGLLQPWYRSRAAHLADDEPEKFRAKVPPSGKLPRRPMWGSQTQQSTAQAPQQQLPNAKRKRDSIASGKA